MQEHMDNEKIHYMKLAKWDIDKEESIKNLTAYDYNFRLWALKEHYVN